MTKEQWAGLFGLNKGNQKEKGQEATTGEPRNSRSDHQLGLHSSLATM